MDVPQAPSNNNQVTRLQQLIAQEAAEVHQLKVEAQIKPMVLSRALSEMLTYMDKNKANDKLLTGFEVPKDNPFIEQRGGCLVM